MVSIKTGLTEQYAAWIAEVHAPLFKLEELNRRTETCPIVSTAGLTPELTGCTNSKALEQGYPVQADRFCYRALPCQPSAIADHPNGTSPRSKPKFFFLLPGWHPLEHEAGVNAFVQRLSADCKFAQRAEAGTRWRSRNLCDWADIARLRKGSPLES